MGRAPSKGALTAAVTAISARATDGHLKLVLSVVHRICGLLTGFVAIDSNGFKVNLPSRSAHSKFQAALEIALEACQRAMAPRAPRRYLHRVRHDTRSPWVRLPLARYAQW